MNNKILLPITCIVIFGALAYIYSSSLTNKETTTNNSPKSRLSEEELENITREQNRIAEGRTPDIIGTSTDIGNGWSVYTNKKFGIAFEYPSKDMKPFEFHYPYRASNGASETYGAVFSESENIPGTMVITITPSIYTSASDWVEKMRSTSSTTGTTWIIKKQITVDGVNGLIAYDNSPEDVGAQPKLHGPWIIFHRNESTYVFNFRFMTDSEINRVQESFRFLK